MPQVPPRPSNNIGAGKPPTKLRGNVLGRLEFEDNNSVIRCLIAQQSTVQHTVCPLQPLDLSSSSPGLTMQVRRLRDANSRSELTLQHFIPRFLAEFNRNCLDQNQHEIKH